MPENEAEKLKWTTVKRRVSDLVPYEGNPRQMTEKQADDLKRSIEKFDLVEIPAIDTDNRIISGHQRLRIMAMLGRGEEEIDVRMPNRKLTEEEFMGYNLRANKNVGEWDWDLLANFDLEMLKDVGFDNKELDKLLNFNPDEKDDEIPEIPEEPKSKLGDIYQLGQNRIMCGDSTKREDVEKLMDGKKAERGREKMERDFIKGSKIYSSSDERNKEWFVFTGLNLGKFMQETIIITDPPYGIDIVNSSNVGITAKTGFGKVGTKGLVKAGNYNKVIGDDKPFDPSFLLTLASKVFLWGANNYASKLPDNAHWLVWDKKAEKGADHNNFSDCELMWTNIKQKSVRIYRYLWSGLLRSGNRNEELSKRVHPTQKPVGLMEEIINDYTKPSDIILDLFLGSGSTIIACEKTHRICYGMEIDPRYIDVCVKRWEEYTKQKAVKIN